MREQAVDALLKAAIRAIEELEGILAMVDGLNGEGTKKTKVSTDLREMASLLDRLPLVQNSLLVIKKRLRGMLSSDPDKTPRAMSIRDLPSNPETVFSDVESKSLPPTKRADPKK